MKKKYIVVWEEKRSITVVAKSEEEAEEMIRNCEYNEAETEIEFSQQPTAYNNPF